MPATAGRVRMPANNRVHSSAALQTHGIWQSAIGYDPYAPNKEEKSNASSQKAKATAEGEQENAYDCFRGLLALASITGSNVDKARGSCRKCGGVGHYDYQCRNFFERQEDDDKAKDANAIQAAVLSGLEKVKGEKVKVRGKNEEGSEEEESESSDTDYDSEMERAVAAKYGRRISGGKLRSSKSRKRSDGDDSDDDDDTRERRKREKRERGRSKSRKSSKRRYSDSDDDEDARGKKRRKEKRGKMDDGSSSSEEEEGKRRKRKSKKERRRRRSHRHGSDYSSDDSVKQRHKRRSRRADSGDSHSDDSRVGRDKKRSDKKSRNHRREERTG